MIVIPESLCLCVLIAKWRLLPGTRTPGLLQRPGEQREGRLMFDDVWQRELLLGSSQPIREYHRTHRQRTWHMTDVSPGSHVLTFGRKPGRLCRPLF